MREGDFAQKLASLSPEQRALLEKRRRGLSGNKESPQPFPARPSGVPAPASFGQQRLWFVHQLDAASAAYHIHDYWRLTGELNIDALKEALGRLLDRHECLRTTFMFGEQGALIQSVRASGEIPIESTDLRGAEKPEIELAKLVEHEATVPFDLSIGPLTRFRIAMLSANEHVLLMTAHHAVYDEWSRKVFWSELSLAYAHISSEREVEFESLPVSYTDYAYRQRENTEVLSRGLEYWRQHLQPLDALHLPFDRARPATPSFVGALTQTSLSREVSARVKRIAKDSGVTLFMATVATFAILLRSHTGQRRIIIGIPFANRSDANTQNLVGLLLNPLPVVIDLSPSATYRELLRQIKQEILNAQRYADVPFELLVEKLRPSRTIGINPLFQVMCVQNQPIAEMVKLPGVSASPVPVARNDSKFDLTLFVTDAENGLLVELEYNTDLFYRDSADALAQRFALAFDRVTQSPDLPISHLTFLTERDQRLLQQWNHGKPSVFEDESLMHQRFENTAQRTPDATAVEQGQQKWTYGEINKLASVLAARLAKLGVGRGVLVPIIASRNHQTVIAIIAVLKAGGAYVPLDPGLSNERLAFILDQVGTTWLDARNACLLTSEYWPTSATTNVNVINVSDKNITGSKSDIDTFASIDSVSLDDPAYVIFTSGSSGRPKGVVVSHANLTHSINARLSYYPGSVKAFLLVSPFWFDSSIAGFFWTFCDRGRLVLPPPDVERRLDRLADYAQQHAISHTLCLPSVYHYLLSFSTPDQLQSFECIIVAGEACDSGLPAQHRRSGSQASLYNEYGPTEATVWSTVCDISDLRPTESVPIGRPIPNNDIYVLDEFKQPAPPGVVGEMYIGGAGVAVGYLNDQQLTDAHFVVTPRVDHGHERLYRTGDLARYEADGSILFLGRKDNQVKVRGHRVELEDIENSIKACPGVVDLVVTLQAPRSTANQVEGIDRTHPPGAPIADERSGILVAWVVLEPNSAVGLDDIKHRVRQGLPDYMVPSRFLAVEELPRLTNGKIDRSALPVHVLEQPEQAQSVGEPLDRAQLALSEMWKAMLNLSHVDIDGDFFELGGHSLLAAQLVTQIEQEIGHTLSIADVFERPTIRGLSKQIRDSKERVQWCSIVPINNRGKKPPFFCVYGNPRQMAPHMDPERPFYWLHHGRDGLLMPYAKIERMAEDHLQQILAIQERGPYFLGGFSVGGLVAFEMARLLQQQDKEVGLLVLFDPTSPAHDQTRWQARLKTTLNSDISVSDKASYVAKRVAKLPLIISDNLGPAATRLKSSVMRLYYIAVNKPMPKKLRKSHRLRVLTRAANQYSYQTYDGAVVLFLPEGNPIDSNQTAALQQAWISLAGKQLETHFIKGAQEHLELMREPFVTDLATRLNDVLARATSRK